MFNHVAERRCVGAAGRLTLRLHFDGVVDDLSASVPAASMTNPSRPMPVHVHDRPRNGSIWQKPCEVHSIGTGASNHSSTFSNLCKVSSAYCIDQTQFLKVPEEYSFGIWSLNSDN